MTQDLYDEESLRSVYQMPGQGAIAKEIPVLDEHCRRFIALSAFLCIGTA